MQTEPDMPDCDAQYLIAYLFEVGPTMVAGMGDGPITHGEIESWQRNIGVELNAWEARTMKRLSLEYLVASRKATARDCPAPYTEIDTSQANRDAVTRQVKNAMAAYFSAKVKP